MTDSFVELTVKAPPPADLVDDYVEAIKNLVQTKILVGVPIGTAGRLAKSEGGAAVGDLSDAVNDSIGNNNAALAYIHNFGAPEANIPARPFLVPGVRIALPKILKPMKMAAVAALEGRADDVMEAIHVAGLICQNEVRRKITTGPFVPLAPRTVADRIAKRKSRKAAKASDMKPLIDTGRLRQAQTYAIEKKGTEIYTNPPTSGIASKVKDS